jgi:hypothetical protein
MLINRHHSTAVEYQTSRNIKRLEFAATIAPLLRFGENQAFVELR